VVVEEEKRRKDARADFDKALTEFREKATKEVNEEELKKKNAELRAEMQNLMEENKKKSEEIDEKIKERQKNSEQIQDRLKTMMQSRIDQMLTESTKEKTAQITLMQKEQELKAQIQLYAKNFDELDDSLKKSGKVFAQLKREIKKVAMDHDVLESGTAGGGAEGPGGRAQG
jgi:hypothetical protein